MKINVPTVNANGILDSTPAGRAMLTAADAAAQAALLPVLPLAGGTVDGNVTLNGTANTAPNQTAAGGTSLMTRDLTDARMTDLMIAGPRRVWLTTFSTWTAAQTGTGASVSQGNYLRCSTGTVQWNYSVARNFQTGELFIGDGDTFNWSKAGGYGFSYYSPGASYRDGVDQIFLGAASTFVPTNGSAVLNPATKGYGWRIKDETIYATMVDNTPTYSEVGNTAAVLPSGAGARASVWLYIAWDGAGNATWYVNGTAIATTAAGPTGVSASTSNAYFIFGSVADATLGAGNSNSISAILLDRAP